MLVSHRILYTPWKIFIIYIILTLLLNLFGPWEYIDYNKWLVIIYISLFLMMGTAAYSISIRKISKKNNIKNYKYKKHINVLSVTKISILISLILYSYMILESILLFGIPDNIDNVFRIMNYSYNDKEFTFRLSYWLYTYLAVFDIFAKTLGLYMFKRLSILFRIILVITYILSFIYIILYDGNQKIIGDIIIYTLSILMVIYFKNNVRIKFKFVFLSITALTMIIYFFVANLTERIAQWGWVPYTIDLRAFANYDHWMIRYLPEDLKIGGITIFNYISNGYYGLSLCLQLPFQWSMGFGSSFAFTNILTQRLNISSSSYAQPYPERMTEVFRYDGYANWNTIFPWLASDFTFFGALIMVCIFIYIYAIAWYKIINFDNWISLVLFAHLNIFLLYIPNNNQLFQTKTSFVATIIIFVLWFIWKDSGDKRNSYISTS